MKKVWNRIIVTSLFGLVIGSVFMASSEDELADIIVDQIDSVAVALAAVPEEPPVFRYGLEEDNFLIKDAKIGKNENLSIILRRFDVSHVDIDRIARKSTDVFNLRRIKQGKKYSVFYTEDSAKHVQYLVYQDNHIDYYVFDMRDTMNVYKGEKEVTVERKMVAGVINSSLYQTLADIGANVMLANEMSDMYAWTINFYKIQEGDKFKVIFEEKFVEGKSVGIGQIKSAVFEHQKREIYAIPFEQRGIPAFYDLQGNGLRRSFLMAPLKFSRISSRYSGRRFHPVQKRYKAHLGTDYAAPKGTPIMATADGTVTHAKYKKYNGNYVKIKHNSTYSTQYLHMHKIANGMKPGKRVRQGDIIGYVGSTGLATGPHVCYRFWKNGKQVDALKQNLPPSDPITYENKAAFDKVKEKIKEELDEIKYEEES